MVIKCLTEADANQIVKLEALVPGKTSDDTAATDVAAIFYHGFDDNDIPVTGPFFPVSLSSQPAIYTNWYVLIHSIYLLADRSQVRSK